MTKFQQRKLLMAFLNSVGIVFSLAAFKGWVEHDLFPSPWFILLIALALGLNSTGITLNIMRYRRGH